MSAFVQMDDLAKIVLPYGSQDGMLLMLSVYFDDSGTHNESEIVVLGGLLGTAGQWSLFNDLWAAKLASPSPGKPPLCKFHMVDCQGAYGEFAGWGRDATDFLCRELADIILACDLWMYGTATFRKDWDELIQGEMRDAAGDAEGACVRRCYSTCKDWSRKYGLNPQIAFVFDNRPQRLAENEKVFSLFEGSYFDSATLTFGSSKTVLPLQAADMIAWETYNHALAIFENGGKPQPFRPPFDRLIKKSNGRVQISTVSRANIENMIKGANVSDVKDAARHFTSGEKVPWTDEQVFELLKDPWFEKYLRETGGKIFKD